MPTKIRRALAAAALAAALLGTTACDDSYEQRQQQQNDTNKAAEKPTDSLEQRNLRKRIAIEQKADQIGYVYLMSFAKPIGYYVVKGKVSSSGSQLAPEQDIVCKYSDGSSCQAVDSAQDDGTYGTGDPGIFFFTSDGVFVHTSLDYVYSTQPLPIEVPLLEGKK